MMELLARQYIPKKYPERYGSYIDCRSCSEDGTKVSDDDKLVFKHIADEDDEYVYVECPECGRGGKFEKPMNHRELRFYITG